MRVLEIDRIMIAIPDIDEATDQFRDHLDVPFGNRKTAEIADANIQLNYTEPGIELLAPGDADDAVADFLERRGPGMYGVVFRVEDLEAAKAELAEKGVEPFREAGTDAAPEAFYHPKHFGGVFTILTEYTHPGFA